MISWWQHVSQSIDPIALRVGPLPIHFYGLFWLIGFFAVWYFLSFVLKRDGRSEFFRASVLDGLWWIFFGALLGGRFGYALWYAPDYFWQHPIDLLVPLAGGVFTGFSGMSFFGGAVGVILTLWLLCRKSPGSFFEWADYYALAAPIALFFGRIGNFFNGELFGRVTTVPWGMYFPLGGNVLRHPSQLYEALLEGVVLFLVVRSVRNRAGKPGMVSVSFLLGYGILRFFVEFFRESDIQDPLFLNLSLGQLYSFFLIAGAFLFFYSIKREKSGILER